MRQFGNAGLVKIRRFVLGFALGCCIMDGACTGVRSCGGAGAGVEGRARSSMRNELWALPPYDLLAGAIVKEAFRAKGLDPPRQAAMSNTLQLISAMVATGRFLGVLSLSTLRLGGKSTAVKVLPVDLPMRRLTIAIVTLKGRSISPAAHLFIECAREIVKPLMKAV
jgi:DNA-binding transcriptional LysR family regulator